MNRRAILLASLIFSLTVSVLHAQTLSTTPGGLDLSASTDNPAPGQTVTITARSYSTDINAAKLTWIANGLPLPDRQTGAGQAGKTVQSGTGLTTLSVVAPPLGKKLNITVTMTETGGATQTSSITIGSGSVDVIVETDGYTPPFFAGKLPVMYQNNVKVSAIPHIANASGAEYDPKKLIYKWEKNGALLDDQNGYGKMSVTIPGDIVPRPYTLTVTVTTPDNTAQAQGSVAVDFSKPFIAFYVDDPLYGTLFNNAIVDTLRIGSERETGILAVPYGFNKPVDGIGTLGLSWLINSVSHPELAANQSIIVRAPENTAGSSNIELDIQNGQQILQGANAGFSAVFTAGMAPDSSATKI